MATQNFKIPIIMSFLFFFKKLEFLGNFLLNERVCNIVQLDK